MKEEEEEVVVEVVADDVEVTFKKKSRANVRKRNTSSTNEGGAISMKRSSHRGDDDDDDFDGNTQHNTQRNTNNGMIIGGSSKAARGGGGGERRVFTYEGDRELRIERGDGGATREIEIDTAKDRDARALREQKLKLAQERIINQQQHLLLNKNNKDDIICGAISSTVLEDDKQYRGTNAYTDYRAGFRKEQTIANEKGGGAHGPARASSNVRITYVMDYKPDICKDYKDSGYCGYGDACKFVHDRGDYKQGWQLDKDWEKKQQEKKEKQAELERLEKALNSDGEEVDLNEDEDEEKDDTFDGTIPSECQMCSKSWLDVRNPIVTKCKHYFCEACALRNDSAKKEKTCFACDMPTGGTFNAAKDILKRVSEMKRDDVKTWGKKKRTNGGSRKLLAASMRTYNKSSNNNNRDSGWALG